MREKYRGIRPAPGYLACPDLDEALSKTEQVGLQKLRAQVAADRRYVGLQDHPAGLHQEVLVVGRQKNTAFHRLLDASSSCKGQGYSEVATAADCTAKGELGSLRQASDRMK